MKVNLNDMVRVRLTWKGVQHAAAQNQSTWVNQHYTVGFLVTQLHALMDCFGSVTHMGAPPVFMNSDIEFIDREATDE